MIGMEGDMLGGMVSSSPERCPTGPLSGEAPVHPPWDPAEPSRTPELLWRAALAMRPNRPTLGWRSVLVVAPHPDDETLGVGATIANLNRRGTSVRVLFLTDGEASHPGSPGLRQRRIREATVALAALGLPKGRIERLGWADGNLGADVGALAASIADRIAGCDAVLSTWPGDGHPDHRAAGIAAQAAAWRLGVTSWWYPIWAWHHQCIDGDLLRSAERLSVTELDVAAKKRALGAYRSQLTDLLGPPVVPPGFLEHHLRPFEVVVPCP